MKNRYIWKSLTLILILNGCGGGGGDVNFGPDNGSSGGSSSGGAGLSGGNSWKITAAVAQDGCRERIADVNQTFTIDGDTIATGAVTITGSSSGGAFSAGFSESNGDCDRSYQIEISDINSSTSEVSLSAQASCGGAVCENKWIGTAVRQ